MAFRLLMANRKRHFLEIEQNVCFVLDPRGSSF